jgi:hypothetical protein
MQAALAGCTHQCPVVEAAHVSTISNGTQRLQASNIIAAGGGSLSPGWMYWGGLIGMCSALLLQNKD